MLCQVCNTMNEDVSSFCIQCGNRLEKPVDKLPPPEKSCEMIHGTEKLGNSGLPDPGKEAFQLSSLRHPKESLYFLFGAIAGIIGWLLLIWIVILFIWLAIPAIALLWIAEQFLKARLMGNSVLVGKDQYPELYEIVETHSRILKLNKTPDVYITNSEGATNAIAVRMLKNKYVILLSGLVDIMLSHDTIEELSSIIGHEMGHHAAGHTSFWKTALLSPAMFIPFFGAAYSRACELTADRIGMYLCGNREAACRGLMGLACGSRVLASKANISAFREQEKILPPFFAFCHDLYSSHPRITKRVFELESSAHILGPTA